MPRSKLGNDQVDHDLTDHEDIDGGPGQTPNHGDSFVYDSTLGWKFVPVAGGHNRLHSIESPDDHNFQGTPTDGQVLTYNASEGKWEPQESQGGSDMDGVVYVDTDDGNAEMVYCETAVGEIELVEVDP